MGKEKVYYFIFMLLIAMYAISFDTYQTFLLFLTVLFFPILLWGTTRVIKNRLSVSFLESSRMIHKGIPFTQKILLKNSSFLPVSSVVITLSIFHQFGEESKEEVLSATVQARGEYTLFLQMCCEYCGLIWIKMEKVVVYDYFGIFKFKVTPSDILSFTILPNLYQMPEFLLGNSYGGMPEAETENRVGDDLSELFGYRTYRDGDRLNRIDWKLTAKHRELIVKEYSAVNDERILLLIDVFSVQAGMRLCGMDAMIDLLYSLSCNLLYQQKKVIISWYDSLKKGCTMEMVSSEDALYMVLKKLYQVSAFLEGEHTMNALCMNIESTSMTDIFYIGYRREDSVIDQLMNLQGDALLHVMLLMWEEAGKEKNIWDPRKGVYIHKIAITDLKRELLSLKEEWRYEDESLKT